MRREVHAVVEHAADLHDAGIDDADLAYTMDNLNRLTDMERGTWGGSSIGSPQNEENFTLNLANAMTRHKLDLNGDGAGSGSMWTKECPRAVVGSARGLAS